MNRDWWTIWYFLRKVGISSVCLRETLQTIMTMFSMRISLWMREIRIKWNSWQINPMNLFLFKRTQINSKSTGRKLLGGLGFRELLIFCWDKKRWNRSWRKWRQSTWIKMILTWTSPKLPPNSFKPYLNNHHNHLNNLLNLEFKLQSIPIHPNLTIKTKKKNNPLKFKSYQIKTLAKKIRGKMN